MVSRLSALSLFQIGIETTHGTAVAATRQLAVPNVVFTPIDAVIRPQLSRGYATKNEGSEFVGMRGTKWSIPPHPTSFQQILNWLALSIDGNVTPVESPLSVYTWTFDRALGTPANPASATLERRITEGANPTDTEWAYALATDWTLAGSPSGEVTIGVNGFARRRQASSLTSLFGSAVIQALYGRSSLAIDNSYAGIGGSLVSTQLIEWSLNYTAGLAPYYTADNRSDLDFSTHIVNPGENEVTFEGTMLVGASYAIEQGKAELIGGVPNVSDGLRYVRLRIDASQIITGSTPYAMYVDLVCKHEMGTIFQIDERDGQAVYKIKLVSTIDGVNPWFRFVVVNGSATIPT